MVITGLDFTKNIALFSHLQNRGDELLSSVCRKLQKRTAFPFAVIITCDRAEVIGENALSHEALERALNVNPIASARCRYSIDESDAEHHLLFLASGILSPLFGEDTVSGQISKAAEIARLEGVSSPFIDKLLNTAVAFSKRMHTKYKMRVFDKSIAEAVARMVKDKHDILVVGSGEGARIVAERLIPEHYVRMTLRDISKTFLIPHGALHVPYERRREMIASSDAVVSASSGLYHTLDDSDLPLVQGKMLFDLSSPPDLPPSFGAWTVSSLGVPLPERDAVIETVKREAEDAVAEYMSWLERAGIAEGVMESAERISLSALRRSSDAITSLQLDPEKEKAFREALSESIRKASVSELIVRKS